MVVTIDQSVKYFLQHSIKNNETRITKNYPHASSETLNEHHADGEGAGDETL